MEEEKTIKEWFEALPDGELRDKLLENMDFFCSKDMVDSIYSAVLNAFFWEDSEEGEKFWEGVSVYFDKGNFGHESNEFRNGYNLAKETMEADNV